MIIAEICGHFIIHLMFHLQEIIACLNPNPLLQRWMWLREIPLIIWCKSLQSVNAIFRILKTFRTIRSLRYFRTNLVIYSLFESFQKIIRHSQSNLRTSPTFLWFLEYFGSFVINLCSSPYIFRRFLEIDRLTEFG